MPPFMHPLRNHARRGRKKVRLPVLRVMPLEHHHHHHLRVRPLVRIVVRIHGTLTRAKPELLEARPRPFRGGGLTLPEAPEAMDACPVLATGQARGTSGHDHRMPCANPGIAHNHMATRAAAKGKPEARYRNETGQTGYSA